MQVARGYSHRIILSRRRQYTIKAFHCDATVASSVSKIITHLITYPVESMKLISSCTNCTNLPSKKLTAPSALYNGFRTYIPFCIFTNITTFNVFYALKSQLLLHFTETIASIFACILTTCLTNIYKIPYTYFLKNKIINQSTDLSDFVTLYKTKRYHKVFVANVVEDAPDLFLKMLCANTGHPLMVTIISSLIMVPLEIWKYNILCHPTRLSISSMYIFLSVLNSVLRMGLFVSMFTFLVR